MLPLKIILLPARHRDPNLPPVFFLAGGPGETATDLVAMFANAPERSDMDIVLVDQRGAGDGHRLQCPVPASGDFLKGPYDLDRISACRTALEQTADLTQYSTSAWVEDLEQVRAALGFHRFSIISGSFGTYAAQEYMRRYSQRVRAAYLLGPVLPSMRVPLHMPSDGQIALNKVFHRCAMDQACRVAYPDPAGQLASILTRLRRTPVPTSVGISKRQIVMTEAAFVDALRVFLYSSKRAARIPFLLDRANKGDFQAFAEVALAATHNIYTGLAAGLNLVVTCNEFVSRIRDQDVAPAVGSSFLGRWRIDAQRAACKTWPPTDAVARQPAAFKSHVPTLIVSGDADPVSQPRWGRQLRRGLRNAVHIVVPELGHTEEPPCVLQLRAAFLRAATARSLDTQCLPTVKAPAFELPKSGGQAPAVQQSGAAPIFSERGWYSE